MATLTLIGRLFPFPTIVGDQLSKEGSPDPPYYQGYESVNMGDSIMGAPMSELELGQ